MSQWKSIAWIVAGTTAALAFSGVVLLLGTRAGLERLPGDIIYRRGNFTLYVPLGLMVVTSVVLTIVLNFVGRRSTRR